MDDPAGVRETKAAIAETGVSVLDIEFVRITPEIDVEALEPFVAAGAELGAKYVITAPYTRQRTSVVPAGGDRRPVRQVRDAGGARVLPLDQRAQPGSGGEGG
jgi:hypothetical protein